MPADLHDPMVELRLICPEDGVDALSEALQEIGALSVSVEDADAQTQVEQALFGEPGMPAPRQSWNRSRVSALFCSEQSAQAALKTLELSDFLSACQLIELVNIPDQDWVRLTQSEFEPVKISDDFWVVPSWHQPPTQARILVRLDPGMAFGTGTHATTGMCLRWLSAHRTSEGQAPTALRRVLDYGCGSGILAIAAAKLGALQVDAVDIDEAAIKAAQENAISNGVVIQTGMPDLTCGKYSVVLANILASPLKVLAPLLCSHVAKGGHLVLAGVLLRQSDELIAAYAPWCKLSVTDCEDEWVLLTAQR